MAKLRIGVPGRSVKLLLQEGGTTDINELGVHPFFLPAKNSDIVVPGAKLQAVGLSAHAGAVSGAGIIQEAAFRQLIDKR